MSWRVQISEILSNSDAHWDTVEEQLHAYLHGVLKQAFMEGYAAGAIDEMLVMVKAVQGAPVEDVKDLSRFPAERAWSKSELNV